VNLTVAKQRRMPVACFTYLLVLIGHCQSEARLCCVAAIKVTGGRYIINGADSDLVAPNGDYPGAGTVFSYQRPASDDPYDRPSVETVLAAGPTNSSVDIMVGCTVE